MSIRKALGAVKDQTSISIAKVSSAVAPEVDVLVVKATSHDDEPAEERHVREILAITDRSRPHVSACASALYRRLHKTRDWVVAVKSLSLLHRLLTDGDPSFREELRYSSRHGPRPFHLPDFRDEAHSSSWDHSAFVRTYSLYLDHLIHSFPLSHHPQPSRRPPDSYSYPYEDDRRYDDRDDRRYDDDGRPHSGGSRGGRGGSKSARTPAREMPTERLLERTRELQQLLDRFLACRPTGRAKSNRLVLVALYPLVKESFEIHSDLRELLGALLDRFPDLEYPDGSKAFDAYATAAKQIDELVSFYGWCRETGVARSSEYPDVERILDRVLESLEDLMRNKGRRSRSPEDGRADRSTPAAAEEPVQDMNSIKALPAPEGYEEKPQEENRESEKKAQAQPQTQPQAQPEKAPDLVDLRDDSVTADSQGNKLAVALFAGPGTGGGNAHGNGTWEAFSGDEPESTSAWQTPAAEAGKADWELALVEHASKLSNQKAALGGGFDRVLLDGMYDQGAVKQQVSAQVSSGSGSSVALPGHGRGTTPVLALPAPDGTVQTIGGDPFAASLTVPPPSYVQMAEIEKKQQLLVQEQQLWQQYRRDGMQGQVSLEKLSLAQNPAAMAMPYGMPPASYYSGP